MDERETARQESQQRYGEALDRAIGEGALTADDGNFEPMSDAQFARYRLEQVEEARAEFEKRQKADAAEQARWERQDFIDRAAIAVMAATTRRHHSAPSYADEAEYALDCAQALWAERERRRLVKWPTPPLSAGSSSP